MTCPEPKKKLSTLFKIFLLMMVVIGFSGIGSTQAVAASSSNIAGTTVSVEQGFSGTVTIKDPLLNKTSNVTVNYQPYS